MPQTPRSLSFYSALWWILALILLTLGAMCASAHATTVTGTVKWQGAPFNGYLDVALVYPSSTGTYLALPGADPNGHLPISNGSLPQPMVLEGNDTLLPRGTYYQFTYADAYGSALARLNYVITGSNFDIGAAVPTPVTPANISFLDLLGLRSVSTQNLAVTNAITIGKATYSATGVAGAQSVNGIEYAAAFALANPTTTTCGVQEAITALPPAGGTVVLQLGACTATSTISITRPLVLTGQGYGGGSTVSGVLGAPSVLVNGMTGSPLIRIAAPTPTGSTQGVTISNFAILGNSTLPGVTGGDCIQIAGGAPSTSFVANVRVSSMLIFGCQGAGVDAMDTVKHLSIDHTFINQNVGPGVILQTPNSGTITSADLDRVRAELGGGDGLQITGPGVGLVTVSGSSFASNTGNGVEIVAGSTASTLVMSGSTATDNHNAGVLLADGVGHSISDSLFPPGSHQLYGVKDNMPTLSPSSTVQLTLRNNVLKGNLTADLLQAATVSNLLLFPQVYPNGAAGVVYTLNNLATVHTIPATTTCSGSSCWNVAADGTIEAWGTVTAGAGGASITAAITFPITFTVAPVVVVTSAGNPGGGDTDTPPSIGLNSITTTGASVYLARVIQAGAGGGTFASSIPITWMARGH